MFFNTFYDSFIKLRPVHITTYIGNNFNVLFQKSSAGTLNLILNPTISNNKTKKLYHVAEIFCKNNLFHFVSLS